MIVLMEFQNNLINSVKLKATIREKIKFGFQPFACGRDGEMQMQQESL